MHRRQIKIFLADGTPTGLRTAELGLSTCKAVVAPRSNLIGLKKRPEAARTGVYVLVGQDPEHAGREAIYVGEGDDVFVRINHHDKDESKDFWDYVVLFVSKDDNLTKAHVRHLEGKLITLARDAKRCTVVNVMSPEFDRLPEADLAEMEELLEHMQLLLGTLGVDAFQVAPARNDAATPPESKPRGLRLEMSGNGYSAQCTFQGGIFTVLEGSVAREHEAPSLGDWARSTRAALHDNGVLISRDEGLCFSQDYSFDSASGAACVVLGGTVNGKVIWLLAEDGRSFKQWEQETLDGQEE
ncbi:MAG: GIY-YIG nuclease family protein [Myxococcota bacterium]